MCRFNVKAVPSETIASVISRKRRRVRVAIVVVIILVVPAQFAHSITQFANRLGCARTKRNRLHRAAVVARVMLIGSFVVPFASS